MWNNGSLRPIEGKFVDGAVCPVVPRGSTWARNPIPRIHTDNIGMGFVGKCLDQRPNPAGPPGVCAQEGAPWCWAKRDCEQFANPCPGLDEGWYHGSATHSARARSRAPTTHPLVEPLRVAPYGARCHARSHAASAPAPRSHATHTPRLAACLCTVPTGTFPPDSNAHEGWCSGDWTLGMVSDLVTIPEELPPGRCVLRTMTTLTMTTLTMTVLTVTVLTMPPGRYVLSWRLDCEETAQVWSSCADVNVVPKRHTVVERDV